MKRPVRLEELRLWGVVAGTVHPLPGKATPKVESMSEALGSPGDAIRPIRAPAPTAPDPRKARAHLGDIDPNRRHRIARERDEIGARLDLHGLTQDRARSTLERFLSRAWDEGYRAVLVITGKGVTGDGILRRAAPEWLAAPQLAHIVAGISEAHRKHGGEGALYVALKRKPRG
jgi:DNA-nicking Smr family endonuclease